MRFFLFFIFLLPFCPSLRAQQADVDTIWTMKLKEVEVKDTRKWENDTVRYRFNQTRYYVQTILPYLEAATRLFNELNAAVSNDDLKKKERRKYINAREEEMRSQFEDKVKALNETQGVLLVKLIARETGVNIYAMLNEFKNPLTAIKWQTWARLNGFNINKRYNPAGEPLLEEVMMSLGYPLPDFYEAGYNAASVKK